MNKNKWIGIVLWVSLAGYSSAEVHFVPRVEFGQSAYGVSVAGDPLVLDNVSADLNQELSFNLYALRLGATVAYKNFYFDSYYQTTNSDNSTQVIPELGSVQVWTAEKDDIYLTLGYVVNKAVAFFVGYRDLNFSADGIGNSEFEFEDDGYFFGGSYSWLITESGSLSINAAYAVLETDLSQVLNGLQIPDSSGDGQGFKLGLTWHDHLGGNLSFNMGIDLYRYDYDLKATVDQQKADIDITEDEITARVGLIYSF